MEEYDPADPTEDGGGGGQGQGQGQVMSSKEDEKPVEMKTDPASDKKESEMSEKTQVSLSDFPKQFGKPSNKRGDNSRYFHEGMADLPSRYDDEDDDDDRPRRRWRDHGDGDSEDEKRFEEEYDKMEQSRFGRGYSRSGRYGRPRHFDDDDDEFGRDGPPRFDDNPFRRLEQGDRPPPDMDRHQRFSRDDDRPPYDDDPRNMLRISKVSLLIVCIAYCYGAPMVFSSADVLPSNRYEQAYIVGENRPIALIRKKADTPRYNIIGADETFDKREFYPLAKIRVGRSVDHVDPSREDDIDA